MPERQSRHPDNDLIDRMREESLGSGENGRAGGNVNRDVGTRAELDKVATQPSSERPVASDNPAQNAEKGPRTRAEIQNERDDS